MTNPTLYTIIISTLICLLPVRAWSSGPDKRVSKADMFWDNNITADPEIPPGASRRHWGRKTGYYAGALMGNGLLGVNFYKLDSLSYRLNVGRSDVTEARRPFNLYNSARLPIGYFKFTPAGKVEDEKMHLSVYDAGTSGTFRTDRGEISFSTYVHSTLDCIVFESSSTDGERDYGWEFVPQQAISPRYIFGSPNIPGDYVNAEGKSNPDPLYKEAGGINYILQPLVSDSTFTETVRWYVVAWKEVRKGSSRRVIATVAQDESLRKAEKSAKSVITRAFAMPAERLSASHRQWWHDFYGNAADLRFPDEEIQRFYWFQYYKFASTARPGKPIVDLQGVWPTIDTPWPAVWLNLNIQLTYSWLTKANLQFLAQPLWDSFWEHRDNLTRNVTDIPGQESWTDSRVLARGASYDLLNPLEPQLARVNQYEAGNLIWTLFYYFCQCEACGDDFQMTERLFPLLKSAVNLFFHIRQENPDGTYSIPSTASPEYFTDREIGPNSNYDLANLRWGLETLISIDEKYALNDPKRRDWEDFLRGLPYFRYDERTGFKLSDRYKFEDTTHRHYSHLFMIYPYHFLSWDNPEDAEKMQLSIDRWQGNTGYSLTGKASMLESKGDGDGALRLMKQFLSEWVRPNTLYNESGPVIETPFSAMCTLQEMYLQDWDDVIKIFPACPSSWKDCSFENMRAKGAFLISAERRGGKTVSVRVSSEKGGKCRILSDGRLREFDMKAGETINFEN